MFGSSSQTTNKTILFTGGGSAGHVTPNLALIPKFKAEGWRVIYMGSAFGIEKELVAKADIPYYGISSGKLRRYFSWENLLTPFQVMRGIFQAIMLCHTLKPNVVFSKGGFVAFPVVVGAWINRIPIVAHESDFSPGLANRLTFPFARKIAVTFSEAKKFFSNTQKVVVTGLPIRHEFLQGNAARGRQWCGFNNNKKILLVYGGGLGAAVINHAVRTIAPELTQVMNIIHVCGKGKIDALTTSLPGYKQYEYLHEELFDVMACANIVLTRAGATSLYELLLLKKPHVLIPLSKKASRGDQILNANYFKEKGVSVVIEEESLTPERLVATLKDVADREASIQQKLLQLELPDSIEALFNLVDKEVSTPQ